MSSKKRWYKSLYLQVLVAIGIGILLGYLSPATGAAMKPLGDMFIKLIKMIIAPIVFCTVVTGICGMEDMKKIGRVGGKALLYFEAVTTLALAIGLLVVNVVQPGAGMNIDPHTLDAKAVAAFAPAARHLTVTDYFLHIIPNSMVDAFARGDLLQVLFFSILFGFSLAMLGEKGRPLVAIIEQFSKGIYGVVNLIMKVAPVGAFGAMAFTIGKYGLGTLLKLGLLMGSFYLTCAIFVFIGLGGILRLAGFSIFKFIHYIRDELLIVLGTSTTEAVLPQMMAKMENLGCEKSVVGLVIPTGYSFNLDGACIYLTMAAIFIAQATNVHLSLWQELAVLAVLLLTSKGGAGIAGSAFVVLAATLSSIGTIPVAGLALILGIDRFMNEARALTNLVGNGVATLVVAKWENALDPVRARAVLNGDAVAPLVPSPEAGEDMLVPAGERL